MRPAELRRRLRRLRALVLDVDGVLTDGGLFYGASPEPLKRFNVKDGMGLRLAREAGLAIAWISGERSQAVLRRARKLKVVDVFLETEDKLPALLKFLDRRQISPEDAAYAGDDILDLPPMERVGLAIAVADAMPQVRQAAHWITRRRGGEGAVREICDAILASRSGTAGTAR
jgi:3-deoxy-D-manno-octulosonate 8-phosphate phosphatase (KDO 8-P phosphatase)